MLATGPAPAPATGAANVGHRGTTKLLGDYLYYNNPDNDHRRPPAPGRPDQRGLAHHRTRRLARSVHRRLRFTDPWGRAYVVNTRFAPAARYFGTRAAQGVRAECRARTAQWQTPFDDGSVEDVLGDDIGTVVTVREVRALADVHTRRPRPRDWRGRSLLIDPASVPSLGYAVRFIGSVEAEQRTRGRKLGSGDSAPPIIGFRTRTRLFTPTIGSRCQPSAPADTRKRAPKTSAEWAAHIRPEPLAPRLQRRLASSAISRRGHRPSSSASAA